MLKTFSLILFLVYSQALYSFRFTPMSQTIRPGENEGRVVFTIENDSDSPMAIELKLKSRKMNIDGSEEQEDLADDAPLTLYPEQLIVPASQKRSVRVSWSSSSDEKWEFEKAYRVIAEQLPVNLKGDEQPAGIKMLLKYVAALYVNPGEQKAQVELKSFDVLDKELELHLHNKGGEHLVLNDMRLVTKKDDKDVEYQASKISGLQGENILAQTERIFKIPLKGDLKALTPGTTIRIRWDD